MSLRWRFLVLFLVAAFVPFAALLAVVQKSLVRGIERDHRRQLEARVSSARRLLEQQQTDDRLAVTALCDHDPLVNHVSLELATERFGLDRERALATLLPRKMRGLRFDVLFLLDARSGTDRGRILGAGHNPDVVGQHAPELLDALARRGNAPFVHEVRARRDDRPQDLRALLHGCLARRDGAAVAVLAGRFLTPDLPDRLLGDAAPAQFALVQGAAGSTEVPDGGPMEVARFEEASGAPTLRLVATLDDGPLRREVRALRHRTLYIALGALLVAFFAAVLMTLWLSRPLGELEGAARRVASGDLESELEVTERGEVGRTMHAFNAMTRELAATRKKLLRAERIAAWREVARRIAHEVKNPLQPIQMEIETMRKLHARGDPDFHTEFDSSTQVILDEVKRLNAMVTEFSRFARLPRPRPEALDLREIVEHVTSLHGTGEVELVVDADHAMVRADREQITQALVNLLQNAIDAAVARHGSDGGMVRVRVRAQNEGATLEVADNGVGIDTATRQKIFEPYFTTKASGTGLGLAIVHRIVGDHGGVIDVKDGIDGGVAFSVRLPQQGPPPEIEASLGESDLPLGRSC